MNQNKNNQHKIKQMKSLKNLNAISTPKNLSRKKTVSIKDKDKSQNKKSCRPPQKSKIDKKHSQKQQCEHIQKTQRLEYYNNTKNYDKSISANISDYNQYLQIDNNYSSFDDGGIMRKNAASPKLKLNSIKGVISFDGKMVKNQLKKEIRCVDHRQNYTNWQISANQFPTQVVKDSKSRKKSQPKKNKSKSRVIKNSKNLKDLNELKASKQSNYNFGFIPQSKDSDATLCTPTSMNTHSCSCFQRNQKIDLINLKEEISRQQNEQEHKKNMHNNNVCQYRQMSLRTISRICGEMNYRKQTFSLAIELFDLYFTDRLLLSKIKLLALACLQLALKLEQGENAYNFIVYLGQSWGRERTNYTTQRSTSHHNKQRKASRQKSQKKGRLIVEKPHKKVDKNPQQTLNLKQQKLLNKILTEQLQQSSNGPLINRNQMLQYQTLIFVKLNFKLWKKTHAYWIDLLTLLWDQFVTQESEFYQQPVHTSSMHAIVFRCFNNSKNISYLSQILECCLQSTNVYQYSKVVLVLSIMYMLIRINMEYLLIINDDKGEQTTRSSKNAFEMYRKTLQKSSNVLFIDRVGCNVLFGTFLLKLEIEMGQILSCCQFISKYLNSSPLLQFNYQSKKSKNYDHSLSYHFFNPKLYEYYSKQSQ